MTFKQYYLSFTLQLLTLLGWANQPIDSLISEIRYCEQQVETNRYNTFDSIEYYALRYLELANRLGDSLEIGKAHLSLGIAYFNLDEYEKEINNLITAKKIFYSIEDQFYLNRAYLEIASLYKEARSENYSPDKLLQSSAFFFESIGDSYNSARCYLELGLYKRNKYKIDANADSILYYYTKALNLARQEKQQRLVGELLNDIADYYLLRPHLNPDTVIFISQKVLKNHSHNTKNRSVAFLNIYLAKKVRNDLDSLTYYLNKGYSLSKKVRPSRLNNQATVLKYQFFKKEQVFDSALYYHELAGINYRGPSKQLNFLKLLFDSKTKEAQLIAQKNTTISAALARQRLINIILIGSGVVLISFIIMIININRKINAHKNELQEKHTQIESLAREIHHRVKNNLQMIVGLLDLQESSTANEAISVVLNDTSSRIKSIALIHQKLYKENSDMISIGFQSYIEELCNNLIFSYNMMKKVDTQLDIDEIEISFDKAVVFGLLITELVTNALKHAFVDDRQGLITIKVKKNEQNARIFLCVKDNGIGIPDNFNENATSFGVDMIRSFVHNLHGNIQFKNGTGTTVEVNINQL